MMIDVEDILRKKVARDDLILKIEFWKTERENELLNFLGESAAFVKIYKAYEADILAAQAKLHDIERNCKHELVEPKDSQHVRCIICDKTLNHNNYKITSVIN